MIQRLIDFLNNIKLRRKLQGIYIFCVIIPIILTDGIIFLGLASNMKSEQRHEMINVANAVESRLSEQISRAEYLAGNIYLNKYLDNYLEKEYHSAAEYVRNYSMFKSSTFFLGNTIGVDRTKIFMYTDNPTIVSGGEFKKFDSVLEEPWYQEYIKNGKRVCIMYYYDNYRKPLYQPERKLLYIMELDYYTKNSFKKLLKIELDYSNLVNSITDMNYAYPVYVCKDDKVLISNEDGNNLGQDFAPLTEQIKSRIRYTKEISAYGEDFQIYVLEKSNNYFSFLTRMLPMLFLVILFNTLLPAFAMRLIEQSLSVRMKTLEETFDHVDRDHLEQIDGKIYQDEIGSLMKNYNRMAARMNELIQTVYKDKLREQDTELARQNAELLALHSQINPHFLFNALESIRMHSVIKEEEETADMIQKLALMQRQYVDWGNDRIRMKQEMEFVKAYLVLQKYRFGNRLSYEIEVDDDCSDYLIPKLTIVTFVENACIHGIESKSTPGWIFVRAYKADGCLCIEVEDTGGGMDEKQAAELLESMQNASMERIREKKKGVGVENACLRIKMATDNKAEFSLESEETVGTTMQILIPLEELQTVR